MAAESRRIEFHPTLAQCINAPVAEGELIIAKALGDGTTGLLCIALSRSALAHEFIDRTRLMRRVIKTNKCRVEPCKTTPASLVSPGGYSAATKGYSPFTRSIFAPSARSLNRCALGNRDRCDKCDHNRRAFRNSPPAPGRCPQICRHDTGARARLRHGIYWYCFQFPHARPCG